MTDSRPCKVIDVWTLLTFGYVRRETVELDLVIPPELIQIILWFSIIELPTLFNLLKDGGATFAKLNYFINRKQTYTGLCTLRSNAKVHKGEEIFCIPKEFIMTSDIAKASVIGEQIISSKIELRSKHTYLASYLLQEREKGPLSRWNVYISCLPKSFENIPFNFTEQEKSELIGSMAIQKMNARYNSIQLEYNALYSAIPEFQRFSLSDFIWARLVVITRIFGFVIDDIKTDGLVPIADFLRHKRPRQTKWTYSQRKQAFIMTALDNIEKDEEVFVSFGRKCNSRFFVNYGFIVENNADNEAVLTLQLSRNAEQFITKANRLGFNENEEKDDDLSKDFQISTQYKDKKVKSAFSFLRICHAQGMSIYIYTYIHIYIYTIQK